MKLLVFASTPPPVHGQSLMVQTLVQHLPFAAPEFEVFHINPRLSHDTADIGRWRPGKISALLSACIRALSLRWRTGPMVFYYVPAPGKRAPLYRDWLVMLLCRPLFSKLVLHWHAVGLGEWLAYRATAPERWLTQWLLGHADLAIVLAPELDPDAQLLRPCRTAVVPNGVAIQPVSSLSAAKASASARVEILFLGLGSRAKGLSDTLEALALAERRDPGHYRLTVAGAFASPSDAADFQRYAAALGSDAVRHVGFANLEEKSALLATANALCFPTTYPHEGQPLVLIEALAHDLPIITTRHRAIPGLLPENPRVQFVPPHDPAAIATAFARVRALGPRDGSLRAHYLAGFTRERHLATLATALRSLAPSTRA